MWKYLFLLSFNVSLAQNIVPIITTYDRVAYGASSKNWSVDVDSRGYVFVGNHAGLLIADGDEWSLKELPDKGLIRSIKVDANDRVYSGGYEEFGYWERYSNGELGYFSLSQDLEDFEFHNEEIWKIIVKEDKVFFQSFGTVFIYDLHSQQVDIVKPHGGILFLLEAGDQLVAQSFVGGLVKLVNGRFEPVENSHLLNGEEVKVVLADHNGGYILGSGTSGLYRWTNEGLAIWDCEANQVLSKKQINHGVKVGGLFVLGTITDGVYFVDQLGKIVRHLNAENSLKNNTVLGLCTDGKGNIWVTHDQGLSFIQFHFPFVPITSESNPIGAVHDAALFGDYLFIGSNQGLYRARVPDDHISYRLGDFSMIPETQGQVWTLRVLDGELLIGHTNGTFSFKNNVLRKVSEVSGGTTFDYLSEKTLIGGTYADIIVLDKEDATGWKESQRLKGFAEPLKYIEVDFQGNIWASHSRKGIYRLKIESDTVKEQVYLGRDQGFRLNTHSHVFSIQNRVVFTSGNGLWTYDDLQDRIIAYDKLNNALGVSANAKRIVESSDGYYWFIDSNNAALFEIDDNNISKKVVLNLGHASYGMVDSYENIVPLSNGLHLVCLEEGFLLLDPNQDFSERYRGKIFINNIEDHLGRKIKIGTTLVEIPYDGRENSIRVDFSVPLYPSDGIGYSTFLEGYDYEWSSYSDVSEVVFNRLPWGDYRLHITGVDAYGQPFETTELNFIISPPWYVSQWAIYAYILSMLFVLVVIRRSYVIKRDRYFRKQQEKLEKEKKELEEKKQNELVKLQNQNLQLRLENKSKELANHTFHVKQRNETLIEVRNALETLKKNELQVHQRNSFDRIIDLVNKNLNKGVEWEAFEVNFDQAHNNFFKRMKEQFPDLTQSDLRICAYLHLNLTSKEIAPLLNISLRAVENHRYRLRKKLGLSANENLVEFLLQF
ncbi:MAG: triple tyrosine motif-containing protein [Cytophagales bacterium]|nr:triple tyrosine motif-containing protein [Cytophagales bacterium]